MKRCPFCTSETDIVAHNTHALAFRDGFPVSRGHTLVIPRRHVTTLSDLTPEERQALDDLVDIVRQELIKTHSPNGFNHGVNEGAAAGQTIEHLHWHVIPRYDGDQEDPRGGIRKIFPEKANYWSDPAES